MKRLLLLPCALALCACSMFKTKMPPPAVAPAKPVVTGLVDANGVPIERIPFRAGVSSVTVERMGKQRACFSNQGAGRVTEPGPVEVYRIVCEDGKVFMARCEMRQCAAM